jgi:CHAT domain-containing protein/Tfp pilus assembly protein PilF
MISSTMGMQEGSVDTASHSGRHWQVAVLVATVLLVFESDQADEQPTALELGIAVEQCSSPGEKNSYSVQAPADSFLRLVVEQQGCDVVMTLFSPDGSRLAEVDSPEDVRGPELLVTRVSTAGNFRLEIRAKTGGCYRLRASMPTANSKQERRRLAAERFATTAAALNFEGDATSRQGALSQYLKALDLWRLEGAELEQARTLHALGSVYADLEESEPALKSLREALPLWRMAAEPHGEANSLNRLGFVYWARGEYPMARQFFSRAVALRRSLGDRCGEAQSLNNLGTLNVVLGKAESALEFYQKALEICAEEEDQALHAALLAGLGGVHQRLGHFLEALEVTARTLPIWRALNNDQMEAQMLSNMAVYYRDLGEPQRALEHYQEAVPIFRQLASRKAEARVLNGLGQVYLQLGEPGPALVVLEQALDLRRAVGDRRGEAVTLHSLGRAHSQNGSPKRAAEFSRQALALRRALGDRTGEASSLGLLGITYHQLGRWDLARNTFQEALQLHAQLGNPHRRAALLRHLGESHLAAGDPRAAVRVLQQSLTLQRQVRNRVGEIETLGTLARAEIGLDRLDRGEEFLRIARELVESLRVEIQDPDLRASFLATQRGIFETSIEVAMVRHRHQRDGGHQLRALALSEQARARSFLELLSEVDIGIEGGGDSGLLARRLTLQQRLKAAAAWERRLLVKDPEPEVAKELAEKVQALLTELQVVEGEMRHQNTHFGEFTDPRLVNAFEMQSLLDDETLLLQYALGEERSFLWAVSSEAVHSFQLAPRQEIEDKALSLHRLWSTLDPRRRQEDLEAAERLRQLILEPAERLILAAKRLVIVADGALHYVPFAALPASARVAKRGATLLTSHEVVHLPSVSVLARLRERKAIRPAETTAGVVVVADPIFALGDPRLATKPATSRPALIRGGDVLREAHLETGFDRLPASRLEALAIASLAPDGSTLLLLDWAARREAVVGRRLAGYRILHFATHGVVDSERPRLSGLALSHFDQEGRPVEGFLALHEIYNLHLDAELVVLSGCRTALGKEIRGEGLVGLSRAFMYAGAERVVASLWRVQDRATSDLMRRFYRALLKDGERPAQALRTAQLKLATELGFGDPYFWAAFVHVGDWQ